MNLNDVIPTKLDLIKKKLKVRMKVQPKICQWGVSRFITKVHKYEKH